MSLSKKRLWLLCGLLVYWLGLFILTHIPIPQIARQSGMSDKTMHTLAYMILVFLLWCTLSAGVKVNWKRARVWLVLAVMVWYGAADEWLQGRMGRSADFHDFLADFYGITGALVILSVLTVRPAGLLVTAIVLFSVNNLSDIMNLYPQLHIGIWVHFAGYIAFTLLWIEYITHGRNVAMWRMKQVGQVFIIPMFFLLAVKVSSLLFDKKIRFIETMAAVVGVVLSILVWRFVSRLGFRKSNADNETV